MEELQGLFDTSKRSPARRKRAKKNKQRNRDAATAKDKAGLPRWTPSAELKAEAARAAAEEHDIVGSPRLAVAVDAEEAATNADCSFEGSEAGDLSLLSPLPTTTRAEPVQSAEVATTHVAQHSRQLDDDASSGGDDGGVDGASARIDVAVDAAAEDGRLGDMKRLLSRPPTAANVGSSSAGQKRARADFEHSEEAVDAKMRCR